MGTRNLIVVTIDGEIKVAQYCQWDGYLSGQGRKIVDFLCSLDSACLATFKDRVRQCVFIDDAEIERRWNSVGSKGGWATMGQADDHKSQWPELSRDTGVDLLDLIIEKPRELRDSRDFVRDSLWCEYAYVIDLDAEVLEIFRGFQTKAHTDGRFATLLPTYGGSKDKDTYYPVRLIKILSFGTLPDAFNEFEVAHEKQKEEENAKFLKGTPVD